MVNPVLFDNVSSHNGLLRDRLRALIRGGPRRVGPLNVVVTPAEINDLHGTGPLVKRILKGRHNVLSIRARDDWGIHDFGDWNVKISQQGCSRSECAQNVLRVLTGWRARSVLCVPWLVDDLLTSIAIAEGWGARLCAYIMDDQNISVPMIPDEIMREFLEKSALRFATHPELRLAYERKYDLPFSILPAVAPEHLVPREMIEPAYDRRVRRAALIGSIWDQVWFDRLCSALKQCHCHVDWYGNNRSPWVKFPAEALAQADITTFGVIPERHLAAVLRQYPFAIVPVGTLDGSEINLGVASLSLPGRILFAAVTSHTPILVVGHENTCGAQFVRHFGIGENVPYDANRIAAAMDRLCDPNLQRAMRRNAAAMGPTFSDRGIAEWLETSIQQGRPADARFEDAFAGYSTQPSGLRESGVFVH